MPCTIGTLNHRFFITISPRKLTSPNHRSLHAFSLLEPKSLESNGVMAFGSWEVESLKLQILVPMKLLKMVPMIGQIAINPQTLIKLASPQILCAKPDQNICQKRARTFLKDLAHPWAFALSANYYFLYINFNAMLNCDFVSPSQLCYSGGFVPGTK